MVTAEAGRHLLMERKQLSKLDPIRKRSVRFYPNGLDLTLPDLKAYEAQQKGNNYEQKCYDFVRKAFPDLIHIGPNLIDHAFTKIPALGDHIRPDIISCTRKDKKRSIFTVNR